MIISDEYGITKINDYDFACKVCGKVYMHYSSATRHLKEIHKGNLSNYNCQICGWTYLRKCSLKIHIAEKHNPQQLLQ